MKTYPRIFSLSVVQADQDCHTPSGLLGHVDRSDRIRLRPALTDQHLNPMQLRNDLLGPVRLNAHQGPPFPHLNGGSSQRS